MRIPVKKFHAQMIQAEGARLSSSKRTRIDVECPDCKGTRKYTGFDTVEPCKTCAGVPDDVEEDKTTEEIDTTLALFTDEDYIFDFTNKPPPVEGLIGWISYGRTND